MGHSEPVRAADEVVDRGLHKTPLRKGLGIVGRQLDFF
jgi:hypothetical protein